MRRLFNYINSLAVAAGLISTPCLAEFYAGGSAGLSTWDDAPKSEGTAYELFGGYRFSEYFGVELAYTDPGSFDYSPTRGETYGTDISGANYSAVFFFPLGDGYGLYAKASLLDYELERTFNNETLDTIRDQDFTYALGFELNAAENLWVTFDYRYYPLHFNYGGESVELNADTLSVGAKFTF